jgi:hypothetical protein
MESSFDQIVLHMVCDITDDDLAPFSNGKPETMTNIKTNGRNKSLE